MNADAYFPLAPQYRRDGALFRVVRERSAGARMFPYTERHIQCVWYDPMLRPPNLFTHEGEPVEVEDAGVWNLEAGPDFLGAVLRVGAGRRRVRGDIETHIHPHDWRAHAHREDPRYARVVAHVTYFGGALAPDELPPGAIQISLRAPLAARAAFSFDTIDVAAYPYAARAESPPCRIELLEWTPDAKQRLLDAAGHERLRRKTARLAVRIEEVGLEQCVYEETFAALGYKQNKLPFRALAARVPLAEWRERAGGDPLAAQAILLGAARLLPERIAPRWDDETRARVRRLWDLWFRHRERWAGRLMDAGAWRVAGLRPANHPARRIAAAASLFIAQGDALLRFTEAASAARALRVVERAMAAARDPYWDRRLGWGGRALAEPVALVGPERARLFIMNAAIPLLAACARVPPFADDMLDNLEPEGDNQVLRQTAFNLFGPHHPASWYRTGMRRQGLIQIFHDYCLNDRSRCAACPFPALLRAHRESRTHI
jgi:hypothetical protein